MTNRAGLASFVLVLGMIHFAIPESLSAGSFRVTVASTPVLANTSSGFEFAVHGAARWEGDTQTAGFNRLIRSFWWVSGEGWCDNAEPGKHCGTIGRVYAAPFGSGSTIVCTSQNGCAANKGVFKPCCNSSGKLYSGKIDVVNLHGGTSIDHSRDAAVSAVPCQECPGPTGPGEPDIPCHMPVPQLHVGTVAGTLPARGETFFSNFPLERVEHLRGMHYLMEEWAIIVFERDEAGALASAEVAAASSSAYGDQQRQSFIDSFVAHSGASAPPAGSGRSVLLVIHHPNHPHNERWIPTPRARLNPGSPSTEVLDARAVVRADFTENRTLSELKVLYSDRPLTRDELAYLENNLRLVHANEDRHRVVLYGVVEIGDGTIGLENYLPVPSMCCCPSNWPDCNP